MAAQPWAAGARPDDLRWLGRTADEVRLAAGAVVSEAAAPARWAYAVLDGVVALGGEPLGRGAVVVAGHARLTVVADAALLAIPRAEEPELRRRFPDLPAVEDGRPTARQYDRPLWPTSSAPS